jgi:hypothetical protein
LFWKYKKMGSVCIIETFCSSWCTISALLVLRIVPSGTWFCKKSDLLFSVYIRCRRYLW